MKTKLLATIALGLMRARMRQTIVAAVGVTFGITMFVALLSFMNGLNNLLDGLILNRTPHVRIYNDIVANQNQPILQDNSFKGDYNFIQSVKAADNRKEIYNVNKIIETIKADSRVAGYTRKVATQVFFNQGGVDITGLLNGIDVEGEIKLYNFLDYIVGGNANEIKYVPNSIILGKPLADKLGANLGDIIQVTTAFGERFQLKVVAYYQSGLNDFDKTQAFASIGTTQKLLGKPNSFITDLNVKLKDINQAPLVAKEYAQVFGISAEDIKTANSQYETGSSVRSIISYAVGITLLIVAGFGIYNILNMMIYEKMDTIAILKATGFNGTDVKRIFMYISITIGIGGCLMGIVFGFLLSMVIDNIPFNTPALPRITTFPVFYSPLYYVIALVFSFITTYLAGWFPARKASKIDPVVIIRGK